MNHIHPKNSSTVCIPTADQASAIKQSANQMPSPITDRHAQAGFTLLEILVVIAILGLLIGLVAPAVLRQLGGAKQSLAKQSIERIASILDLYKLDVGSYPSTEEGLAALNAKPAGISNWNGPYLKGEQSPLDPWNHVYIYRNPSNRTAHDFDLCSRGANAQTNEAATDSLICNP